MNTLEYNRAIYRAISEQLRLVYPELSDLAVYSIAEEATASVHSVTIMYLLGLNEGRSK